jgi:hypothetical protein
MTPEFNIVRRSSSAQGQCPDTTGIITICKFDRKVNCRSDDQCKDGFKCCSYGCGKRCLRKSTYFSL